MSINLKETLSKLQKAGAGKSRLGLRNEKRQVKAGNGRLPGLKKEKNKHARLLILKELAIPFDPFSVEVTDEYNDDSKYRPELSVGSLISTFKEYYNTNPEAKEKFLAEVGVNEWDTSKPEVSTKEDKEIFRKYTVPKIVTTNMVNITSPIMNKVKFPCGYRVNFVRDGFGDVVLEKGQEYPKELAIANFYKGVYLEAYNKWEQENSNKPDADKKEMFKKFISRSPVSVDFPKNTVLVFELPLNQQLGIDGLGDMTVDDIKKCLRTVNKSQALDKEITDLSTTYAASRDSYIDFFECDMMVGNEDDDMLRGKNTKFVNAETKLQDIAGYDKFIVNLRDAIDQFTNQEEAVVKSVARNKIDDSTLEKLAEALEQEQPIESIEEFISKEATERNAGIIGFIYGDKADELLMSPEDQDDETVSKEQSKFADEDIRATLSDDGFNDVSLTDDDDDEDDE